MINNSMLYGYIAFFGFTLFVIVALLILWGWRCVEEERLEKDPSFILPTKRRETIVLMRTLAIKFLLVILIACLLIISTFFFGNIFD